MRPDERYVVISADCHGGADVLGYRDYLPRRFHDDFDAWAADYEIPYEDLTGPDGNRNWDSARRLADLEADGIVAEVIYPNTVPPFFPRVSLSEQPPAANAGDLEYRAAGLAAHNRWLAEFCADAPGRRAGVAQILLHDVEAAVAEVRWAKEAGLTGGVLLPGAPPGSGLPPLYDADRYEPLWAVCEDLDVPVNHHSGSAVPPMGDRAEDKVVLLLEAAWWAHRAFTHLLVAGVFERHPDLRFVLTEQGSAWVPDELARLDYFFGRMGSGTASQELAWGRDVVARLSLPPSGYWARQCQLGASFIRPAEVAMRDQIGVDKIMWGSDYPHKEASFPYSHAALAGSFAGVPHEETAAMLAGNAARVYGFDLAALAPLAARVGPTAAEVDRVITRGSLPPDAAKCPALAEFAASPAQV
jgi:predicted TIM-barrel fold metal-dependent hydrolase